jgi:hypothetical protein
MNLNVTATTGDVDPANAERLWTMSEFLLAKATPK